jgi:hypothetical protein
MRLEHRETWLESLLHLDLVPQPASEDDVVANEMTRASGTAAARRLPQLPADRRRAARLSLNSESGRT